MCLCGVNFRTNFALDQHAKETKHQAYKCKCGTTFNKHSALQRHINTKDTPNTFACTLCDDSFARKDKLKDHCRLYHKVKGERLEALFNSKESRPRGAAASRRRQAPVSSAAASSAPAPTLAPAPPTLAPASAGPSVWSPQAQAYTGQQYAGFSADLSVPTGQFDTTSSFLPTGSFVPAAGSFAATAVPGEDILGTLDDILGDATWTTNFNEFGF